MKFSIISDTHFGDPECGLVTQDVKGHLILGDKYNDFKKSVGKNNDYLILVGDIFDFSIASYKDAYTAGQVFFKQIQADNITKEIIYIPGNHDFDMWHIIEYEVNVINQVKRGKSPRESRFSVPGVIDDRKGGNKGFFKLPDVSIDNKKKKIKYAGLFLDNITGPNNPTYFNFSYPNLYLMTDTDTFLITHGQYLESFWSLASEWLLKIAPEALKVGDLDLKEMVAINFPLTQLSCSGIGQAGPLTKAIQKLQRDIKDGKLNDIKKYIDKLDYEIDKKTNYSFWNQYKEWITDILSNKAKELLINQLQKIRSTRFDSEFVHKEEVRKRFINFYKASLFEIDRLNNQYNLAINNPNKIIFGHTHEPISLNDNNAPKININGQIVKLFNTGGWLYKNENNQKNFVGAEIFLYETGKGFSSLRI